MHSQSAGDRVVRLYRTAPELHIAKLHAYLSTRDGYGSKGVFAYSIAVDERGAIALFPSFRAPKRVRCLGGRHRAPEGD